MLTIYDQLHFTIKSMISNQFMGMHNAVYFLQYTSKILVDKNLQFIYFTYRMWITLLDKVQRANV